MRVGLTGGIASGKSTVSAMLQRHGAYIVDADQIAREVVEPGTEGAKKIREEFGDEVFLPDGRLDRVALGGIVFQNEGLRKKLNQILHPPIRKEMVKRSNHFESQNVQAIVIWDVPLLFESKLTNYVEKVIVVYVPEKVQLERLMNRNHLSEEEARRRIDAQLSIEEKKQWADYLIDNSGSIENTERQVGQLWSDLKLKSGLSPS